MLDWFRRLRKASRKLSLPSRDATSSRGQSNLNLSKLTPDIDSYLAQLRFLTLRAAEAMSKQADFAPNAEAQLEQLKVAELLSARAKELSSMLAKRGVAATEASDTFSLQIDEFLDRIQGIDWYEQLISYYLAYGILEDLFEKLADGLGAQRSTIRNLLADDRAFDFARQSLAQAVRTDSVLASRLALFGRAIVADVLLQVRVTVDLSKVQIEVEGTTAAERARAEFKFLEPLTGELIATHTMRMDSLGLSA